MFNKVYLSRAQTRAMSIDHPIGDPFGGAMYGELRDPVSAAIVAGGSLLSGVLGGAAAKSAANTQADAAQAGIDATTQAKNDQLAALSASLQQQLAASGGQVTPEIQNAQNYILQVQQGSQGYLAGVGGAAGDTLQAQLGTNNNVLGSQLNYANNVYQQQQNYMNPTYQAGMQGQGALLNYLGLGANTGQAGYGQYANAQMTPQDFLNNADPSYGFVLSQGMKAMNNSAAAAGGLQSGNALKAAQNYGQQAGMQYYQNAFNNYQTARNNTLAPLQQLTNQGANAAGSLAGYAGNYGNLVNTDYTNYGNNTNAALGTYGNTMTNAYGNVANANNNAYGTGAGMINNAYSNVGNLTGAAYGTYGNNVAGVYGNYGTNLSNLYGAQGQANASGTVGSANALTGAVTNGLNSYNQGQLINTLQSNQTPSQLSIANSNALNGGYGTGFGGGLATTTYGGMGNGIQAPSQAPSWFASSQN